jgi:hypothetical protein
MGGSIAGSMPAEVRPFWSENKNIKKEKEVCANP